MDSGQRRQLGPDDVRFRADLSDLGIESTDDLDAEPTTVGQPEALEALELGITLRRPGYNVFLSAPKGTGRFALVRTLIGRLDVQVEQPPSHAYVHDFDTPEQPALITLPPGMGRRLRKALDKLRETLAEEIPAILGSEVLARRRQQLMSEYEQKSKVLFGELDRRADEAGFKVVQGQTDSGTIRLADVVPLVEGEPVPMEQVFERKGEDQSYDTQTIQRLESLQQDLKGELVAAVARHRALGSRYRGLIDSSETECVREAIAPVFDEARNDFVGQNERVGTWLDSLLDEICDNLQIFRDDHESADALLSVIRCNLVNDPGEECDDRAPVVEESYPTYRNLFGTVEIGTDPSFTSFMDIRCGSLLQADGGFLLLSARDVVSKPAVWEGLKRTLRTGMLEIAPADESRGVRAGLKPEPIPIDVRVVLVGPPILYEMLAAGDPDFATIFKVKAEFDDSMPRNPETTASFLSVLKRVQEAESLPPFSRGALERLVDEGVRLAASRKRLTTRFSDLTDVMREAAHYAKRRESDIVKGRDVESALRRRRRRHGLSERRLLELIEEGKILVEVDGARVGQINGLAFYHGSATSFGAPARISATAAPGRTGVVNIEREAELSGSIHDKGVLILSGFLAATFAQQSPLSLNATVAFEQSYGGVDGDSASLAELIALLSSLSGRPLRQDIAVTGSLNQRGFVQPVGGVTEKVEGFFHACRTRGLTGKQGVVLPATNVEDLQLHPNVVQAVSDGRFHVYPVSHFEEALELMTGQPPSETLATCSQTLGRYAEIVREFR